MQAEERQRAEPSADRSRESDLAIDIVSGLAGRMDRNRYESVRAQGRREGESALEFELRCIDEATPCSKS